VVIIGGSVAGLVTAAVLSKHSKKVIIIERSRYEQGKSIAKQGNQLHLLVERGLLIWEKIFPGITQEMKDAGGVRLDWGPNFEWWCKGGKRLQLKEGIFDKSVGATRSLFEYILRRRVFSLPNVEVKEGYIVKGFIKGVENLEINGVKVLNMEGLEENIVADLTVDCSGMTSETPHILKQMGAKVETTSVKVNLVYSGVILQFPEQQEKFYYYQPFPPDTPRGVAVVPIEGNRLIVCCGTYNKYPYPKNLGELKEFLKDMPFALDLFEKGYPINEVNFYKKEGNVYHYYEKLDLDGLIALGDSVCNFNPAYAQGQTTASEAALLLDTILREDFHDRRSFCKEFQIRLSRQLTVPWLLVTISDLRFPKTVGGGWLLRSLVPVGNIMLDKLTTLCAIDEHCLFVLLSVMNLRQGFIWKVLSPKTFWNLLTKSNPKQGW